MLKSFAGEWFGWHSIMIRDCEQHKPDELHWHGCPAVKQAMQQCRSALQVTAQQDDQADAGSVIALLPARGAHNDSDCSLQHP